jgi:hypothetical protein
MATQNVELTQETAWVVVNPLMLTADDQEVPLKVIANAFSSTAIQNDVLVHETSITAAESKFVTDDQALPVQVR